jgi:hypothetical protein
MVGEWLLNSHNIDEQAYKSMADYQTWRALSPPPQDRPLALCDARTVERADIVELGTAVNPADSKAKQYATTLAKYNPAHRWVYFPNMTTDELLVFRGATTDPNKQVHVLHASFLDPSVGNKGIPRQSIDARYLCFYK